MAAASAHLRGWLGGGWVHPANARRAHRQPRSAWSGVGLRGAGDPGGTGPGARGRGARGTRGARGARGTRGSGPLPGTALSHLRRSLSAMSGRYERLAHHTASLLTTARTLDDPSAPSRCTGWSRGHVLTHVARNADGMAGLVRAATEGTGETMYLSDAARDADIEAGAGRPLGELVEDVEDSARRLAELLPRLDHVSPDLELERVPGGAHFRAGMLLDLRLREVVYHHVDLAAGFTFADVEPDLVRWFLDDEYARLGDAAHRARAADLLWRARGQRDEGQ